MSSFTKKGSKAKARQLPSGTRPSLQNAQLLVSTGISSFDTLLGGGIAVGSVLLVDEDEHRAYSDVLLKYFMSEGVAVGNEIVVGSADVDPLQLVRGMYQTVTTADSTTSSSRSTTAKDKEQMEISWRYANVPKVQSELGGGANGSGGAKAGGGGAGAAVGQFCHRFDLQKTFGDAGANAAIKDANTIDLRDACDDPACEDPAAEDGTKMLPPYDVLYKRIAAAVQPFHTAAAVLPATRRNVLRVGIHSLASPVWPTAGPEMFSFVRFMQRLRALMRQSYAVCMVTAPGKLLSLNGLRRAEWLSDAVVGVDAFAGTKHENNSALREYHGFFELRRQPRLNSLGTTMPETLDLAFKLKRKALVIEKLHLPPDLSETVSRSQGSAPVTKSQVAASAKGKPKHGQPIDF